MRGILVQQNILLCLPLSVCQAGNVLLNNNYLAYVLIFVSGILSVKADRIGVKEEIANVIA